MNLKTRLILYLLFVHAAFAFTIYFLFPDNRLWIFVFETFFVISFYFAFVLIKVLFKPFDIITTGSELIKEKDFTSKFMITGLNDMDRLIDVYNYMIDQLREERLKLQEKSYFIEKILQESPTGVIIFDFDDKIDVVSPRGELFLNSTAEKLAGKKLENLKNPFALKLGKLIQGESDIIQFDGNRKLKCSKSHFFDRGFTRNFIMMEEMTEELRQSEKTAFEKIIRIMAHEVNNSIGAANSLLHSCLNYKNQIREEDRKDFETALSVAISRADHLNKFTRSFADVIRLPEPKLHLCDIKALLKDIIRLMKNSFEQNNIELKWETEDYFPLIKADRNQIEQVILNIIKNSVEAIENNGTIVLRLGYLNKRRFVEIEDSGKGIPEAIKDNIFTPFYSTKENGSGIGLTMIQEILSKHKFDFSLESLPEEPTKFRIYFN